jgi:hypothetical protein
MEYSELQKEFMARVASNENSGFHLVVGWAREEHYRTALGKWACTRCPDTWTEKITGKGTFAEDDFLEDLCPTCGNYGTLTIEDEDEVSDDLGFSHENCDCCGSPLGGDRHAASLINPGHDALPLSVCSDCLMYIANGDVPDDECLTWMED